MTTASDISALKARCTAIETVNKTQATQISTLANRVTALEAVKPVDLTALSAAVTALTARVAALEAAPLPEPAPIGPAPGTVYREMGMTMLRAEHDLVYDGVRFTGPSYNGSTEWGVLNIIHDRAGGAHDLTFRNCYFKTCTTPGANIIHIQDQGVLGEAMHGIVFDHCYFESSGRITFECNERRADFGHATGDYPGAYNISLTDCYFAVNGSEVVSFDNNDPNHVWNGADYGGGLHTVSGCYFEGCDGSYGQWPYVFETNRVPHMRVLDNTFGPGSFSVFNTRCTDGDAHQGNMDWVYKGNTVDATKVAPGHIYSTQSGGGKLWMIGNVTGGVTVSDTLIGPPPFAPGSSWGYFNNCAGLDFSGSTLKGYASNVPSYEGGTAFAKLPVV